MIPDPSNPQSFNRYSYVLNNPLRYTDPSGHAPGDTATGDSGTEGGTRWTRVIPYTIKFNIEIYIDRSFVYTIGGKEYSVTYHDKITVPITVTLFLTEDMGSLAGMRVEQGIWEVDRFTTGGEGCYPSGKSYGHLAYKTTLPNELNIYLSIFSRKDYIKIHTQKLFLVFDGKYLKVINASGQTLYKWKSVSGGFGKGRAPEGKYIVIHPRRRTKKGMVLNNFGFSFDILPQFNTKRSELRIHPDAPPVGTAGCISIQEDYDKISDFYYIFKKYIEIQKEIRLKVKYE